MPDKDRKYAQHGMLKGPPEPINDRIRLKLLISDKIKEKRGLGTKQDAVERSLEGRYAKAPRD